MNLEHLNQVQQQAVVHGNTPLLVLAGAGTGKTTVITHRIAYFIHQKRVRPDQILAVTFTNKAAREMRERTAVLAQVPVHQLDIGTFHGICGKLLRRHGEHIGLNNHFVIYADDEQLQLIRKCIAELGLSEEVYPPKIIQHRIDKWKNQGQWPHEVTASHIDPNSKVALQVYKLYTERCLTANAVDFNDMLLHTVTLLRKFPDIRQNIQQRFTHILVDEYQDTNPVQYMFLKELATDKHSLTAVGDDDQSIYRWRGADINNILRFEQDFPNAALIRLEQNYRSTKTILHAANHVIAHNHKRKGKNLFTEGTQGKPIKVRVFGSERDEADGIAETIAHALIGGLSPLDVAVLYRTNAQSRPLEDSLRRLRIPYRVFGGMRFYDRKEIKDSVAYLRLLMNPQSDVDFIRIINVPARGIGKTSLDALIAFATVHKLSLFAAAQKIETLALTQRAKQAFLQFVNLILTLQRELATEHPARLFEKYLQQSGYIQSLNNPSEPQNQERLENIKEFISAIDEYCDLNENGTLIGFLEEIALAQAADEINQLQAAVSLMTLHTAKGLEFSLVFMPGMEEGLFPHSRSLDDPNELEEERRLCYVGITRAKHDLMLSMSRLRYIFGQPSYPEPSRFLTELPQEVLNYSSGTQHAPKEEPVIQRIEQDPFSPGHYVIHATFGKGKVVASEGSGKLRKLAVQFQHVGKKVIVAQYLQPAG